MVGTTLGLLLVGFGGAAQATEVDLLDDIGDGYAIYGVDETGTLRGCGDTGIAFDPLGAIAPPAGAPTFGVSTPTSGGASQANCSSAVYLFETTGAWRQGLRNGAWSYHPVFATGFGLAPLSSARATDVLTTDANVLSDTTIGTARRVTTFEVAAYPDLQVELEQTVCGAALYQEYTYELIDGPAIDVRVSRVTDGDLEWGTRSFGYNYNYNVGYGITAAGDPTAAVGMSDALGQVDYTIEMSGDAAIDGWRLWQCRFGGASEFARMMTADGWTAAQLNRAVRCTGGPWWNKSESTGTATVTPSANDTTIGLQGELALDVGVPQTVVYVTEMAPGAPTDGWTATASAAPDNLWPPNGTFASIAVDVEELDGCGVECAITGVSADQAIDPEGSPDADYAITGDLTVDLRQEKSGSGRTYTIELTCEDHFGNLAYPTTTVRVSNPNTNAPQLGNNGQSPNSGSNGNAGQ